ncbi:hypothetical protein V9K67_18870 [Paraflavisolibacter sp. H34]|uniref:hypothetical protein n=1 Tax=Huijunlia imazamoxiresistens TaxID=3127457 RepID=UPI003019973E
MLAVHWTPVNRTKNILKNGITKSKTGLYCFPLTGHKALDRWWITFFKQRNVRSRNKYNGIVFRLTEQDLPACFGHWIGSTTKDSFSKETICLKALEAKFRETILWRMGEELAGKLSLHAGILEHEKQAELFLQLAEQEIRKAPGTITGKLNDLDFMTYTFEDYQIVLSNSIAPGRIIKILPQGDEYGRVRRLKKKS